MTNTNTNPAMTAPKTLDREYNENLARAHALLEQIAADLAVREGVKQTWAGLCSLERLNDDLANIAEYIKTSTRK